VVNILVFVLCLNSTSFSLVAALLQAQGKILILVLVLVLVLVLTAVCLHQRRFHGEIRIIVVALLLALLVKTRLQGVRDKMPLLFS